jgi:copper chaperone CopZ
MASSEPIECQVPMFSPLLSLISFPGPDRVPVLVHVCRARNWSSSSACLIPVPAVQPLFLFSSSSSSFCLILLLLSDPSVTVCPVLIQVVALRVSIHCQGCKKKVKKVLQNISGTRRTLLASGSFSLPPTRRSLALSKALLTQLLAFDCSTYSALVHAFFFLQAIAGLVLVFFLIGKITKQSRWQVSGTV